MSINRDGSYIILTCDICGEESHIRFFEFNDAVEFKKENGWRSTKDNNGWVDVCPDCQHYGID